jgi:polar amino acid transport system substrate-binding protein
MVAIPGMTVSRLHDGGGLPRFGDDGKRQWPERDSDMTHVAKVAAGAVLIGGMLSLAAGIYFSRDRSLTMLRETGAIRIGYAVESPYAFLKPGGEVTGESPEVAREIVKRLGIARIEWRQCEFGSLITELESDRADVIASGMFITAERAQRVLFSEPTFHVRQALLVARGNPLHLHSYEQSLELKNVRIAVISGAIEETLLRHMKLPENQLVLAPDALAGCVAVESGVADGLALSSPTVQWMALREHLGKTEVAQPFVQPGDTGKGLLGFGAFAFRKEDRELQSAWNDALKGFIGSPEHRKLVAEFGFTEAELPGNTTTAEVLGQ